MKTDIIIDQETQKVKLIFDWKAGKIGERLTAVEAENVVKFIEEASQNAGREVFKAWLTQHECHDDVIVIDGKTYRFRLPLESFIPKVGRSRRDRRRIGLGILLLGESLIVSPMKFELVQ